MSVARIAEPTHLSVFMKTELRGKPLTIYMPEGGGTLDAEAGDEEVEINGHLVTDEELDRGWVVVGEWM